MKKKKATPVSIIEQLRGHPALLAALVKVEREGGDSGVMMITSTRADAVAAFLWLGFNVMEISKDLELSDDIVKAARLAANIVEKMRGGRPMEHHTVSPGREPAS